uniref:Secreted protein n=1 Tax=Thraustotheca clavata TaxID=74557 RepID=A0A0A7CLE8_9STRA|nr:secreted protein [Thraustotheca clavata]
MKVLSLMTVAVTLAAAATTKKPVPTLNRSNGVCLTDADCKPFPGTVCVQIVSGDYSQGKCTPNYGTRPVCRGGQAGLCPSYQDASLGYVNTQCVLVNKASQAATDTDAVVPVSKANSTTKATSGSGSADTAATTAPTKVTKTVAPTAAARFLAVAANATVAPAKNVTTKTTAPPVSASSSGSAATTSGSGSAVAQTRTPVKSQPCPTDDSLVLADPGCWFNTDFQNTTITVQYKCVDYNMCLSQSAYSQAASSASEAYCRPKGCVTGEQSLCNNRGTCQANSIRNQMLPSVYSCRCYAGYTGTMCEKTDSTADCDVDCGLGGACVDNMCSCYNGYLGKNIRCDKCTSNVACENSNKCNLDTGKCSCTNGYNGPTCGGKLDICAGVKCSGGGYTHSTGSSCQCLCPRCQAGSSCETCGGLNGTDCSTCSASATFSGSNQVSISIGLGLLMLVAALF